MTTHLHAPRQSPAVAHKLATYAVAPPPTSPPATAPTTVQRPPLYSFLANAAVSAPDRTCIPTGTAMIVVALPATLSLAASLAARAESAWAASGEGRAARIRTRSA